MIPALNGFPGPYTHYVEDTLTKDGILKLMDGIENREAYFIEVLAYTELEKEPVVFVSKTKGSIAYEKSGEFGWSYDKIFIPYGEEKTLSNFSDDERWKFWDDTAYEKLAEHLNSKNKVRKK